MFGILVLQPDKAAAVPKFGDWDESDPASADGYTQLFNKVREEKAGAGQAPGTPTQRPYVVGNRNSSDKTKVCQQCVMHVVVIVKLHRYILF